MKRETFFNNMAIDYTTDDGRELALINDLREMMTENKDTNIDFYKNIIFLCWNYLQELNGTIDENGDPIIKELVTPAIDYNPQELEYIDKEIF